MVYRKAHRIPQPWSQMPLVNQSGCIPIQNHFGIFLGKEHILFPAFRIIQEHLTAAMILGSGRLAAPFSPFNHDSAHTIQAPRQFCIQDPRSIFFVHNRLILGAKIIIILLIIKFGGILLSNLAEFYYQIWRNSIIKFGENSRFICCEVDKITEMSP
jgi:hypothetical protein